MDLLGEIHSRGLYGQPVDPEAAAQSLMQAVIADDRRSLRSLAVALLDGRIPVNDLAAALLGMAADAGVVQAREMREEHKGRD